MLFVKVCYFWEWTRPLSNGGKRKLAQFSSGENTLSLFCVSAPRSFPYVIANSTFCPYLHGRVSPCRIPTLSVRHVLFFYSLVTTTRIWARRDPHVQDLTLGITDTRILHLPNLQNTSFYVSTFMCNLFFSECNCMRRCREFFSTKCRRLAATSGKLYHHFTVHFARRKSFVLIFCRKFLRLQFIFKTLKIQYPFKHSLNPETLFSIMNELWWIASTAKLWFTFYK